MTLLLLAAFASGVRAADDVGSATAEKRADIKRLMEVSGVGSLASQIVNQMISTYKQGHAGVPDKFWDGLVAQSGSNELLEMCLPSYERHFTHEEIKELIRFYETPIGAKLVRVQPQVLQECMVAGEIWRQKLADKIAQSLRAKGYR